MTAASTCMPTGCAKSSAWPALPPRSCKPHMAKGIAYVKARPAVKANVVQVAAPTPTQPVAVCQTEPAAQCWYCFDVLANRRQLAAIRNKTQHVKRQRPPANAGKARRSQSALSGRERNRSEVVFTTAEAAGTKLGCSGPMSKSKGLTRRT